MKTDNPGPPGKREEGKMVCQEQKKHHRGNIKAMEATEGSTRHTWVCVVRKTIKAWEVRSDSHSQRRLLKGMWLFISVRPEQPHSHTIQMGSKIMGRWMGDLYENNNNHGPLRWNRTTLCTILSHTSFHLKQWRRGLLTLSRIYSPSCPSLAWVVTTAF